MAYIYNGVQQPISLQEYLTLPLMVKDAYDTAEKQYNDYQDKVAAIKAMSVGIPEAQSEIQAYEDSISDLSDYISNHRYDNKMRIASNNLRDQFRNRVIPISTNITALQKYMQDFSAKDDGTILGRKLGYKDFAENPLRQYQLIQGSAIRNEAAKMAAAASARRIQDAKESRINGGQYFRTTQEQGFSEDDVKNWESIPELSAIRDQLYRAYGSNDFNPAEMDKYIAEGIYLGAQYNRQIKDKLNYNYGVQSNTNQGLTFDQLLSSYLSGKNNIGSESYLRPNELNLSLPNNYSDENGNWVQTFDSATGRVILKSPMDMLASIGHNGISNKVEANNWVRRLAEYREKKGDRRLWNRYMNNEVTDQDYKDALAFTIMSHKNGKLVLKTTDQFKGQGAFTWSKSNYEDLLQQFKNAGIDLNRTYNSIDEFIQTVDNAYNNSGNFKSNARITSFKLINDRKEFFSNIGTLYELTDATTDKDGYVTPKRKALSGSEEKAVKEAIAGGIDDANVGLNYIYLERRNQSGQPWYYATVHIPNGKDYRLLISSKEANLADVRYDDLEEVSYDENGKPIYSNGVRNSMNRLNSIDALIEPSVIRYNELKRQLQIIELTGQGKEKLNDIKRELTTLQSQLTPYLLQGTNEINYMDNALNTLGKGIIGMSNKSEAVNVQTHPVIFQR